MTNVSKWIQRLRPCSNEINTITVVQSRSSFTFLRSSNSMAVATFMLLRYAAIINMAIYYYGLVFALAGFT
jgi:hypothetical protein